jgi:hypothetical protein
MHGGDSLNLVFFAGGDTINANQDRYFTYTIPPNGSMMVLSFFLG